MPLSVGTKLGPYEILAPIGAGGMGEVYKARDPRLNRDIALKVSKAEFTERFKQEAQMVAQLNHPNICTLHDVGPNYLVMELVDGVPLKGPLPVEKAVEYAGQILDALDAAHRKSITHRDLKPANILVTKQGIKLLDFGLAKQATGLGPDDVTIQAMTAEGQISGTLQYMSPEQLQGKKADARSDIFSFGCVLHEMLTGIRAFDGANAASIIAAVMERPAPSVGEVAPAALDRVVKKCLAKDPDDRWQTARDLRDELLWIAGGETEVLPQPAKARPTKFVWAAAAMLAIVAAVALAGWWRATRPAPKPLLRLDADLGPDAEPYARQGGIALSPDGTRLVYAIQGSDKKRRLAVRSLDSAQTTPLPGTEDAVNPFFSPDGQWIGFFAGGKLMKINVLGGAPVTLCDVRGVPGGSWGEDDEIIVSGAGSGLSGVPASGGSLRPVTQLDAGKGEFGHFYPQVLPGGAAVLFTAGLSGMPGIEVQTLRTGQRKTLVTGAYFGRYAPSGHLLYLQQGTLFAASMDLKRLELTGQPRPVLQNLETDFIKGYPQFDFSRTGTFATFLSSSGQSTRQTLRWLEPSGQPQALPAVEPADYNRLRLSPDGKRLAEIIIDGTAGSLWIRDLQAERVSRLTFKGSADAPAWTPDGAHIAYYLSAGTKSGIYWTRADGAGEPVLLREKPLAHPDAFSPEGKWLMYHVHGAGGETSIWKLSVDANDPEHPRAGQPEAFLQGPSSQEYASFSPDGRFIAYKSNESGREEVYVRPFPGPGGKWLISGEGGTYPLWSRSAHELLYFGFDGRIQVTDYTVQGDSFVAAKPRPWSPAQVALKPSLFDLMPDGKRMVMALPQDPTEGGKSNTHVTMLVNFFDDLRLRAPVGK